MTTNKHLNTFLIPKEISWLSFNGRVLQEAANPEVPLIERIRFLSIFSSNLDEFYRIRVAILNRISKLGKKAGKIIGYHPEDVLERIRKIGIKQQEEFNAVYADILKELSKENIFIINEKELDEDQGTYVTSFFRKEVRPKLIPIMIGQVKRFPDLRDESIYLAVRLSNGNGPGNTKYALIEISEGISSRFLIFPLKNNKQYIMLLDDVIRHGLSEIFSIFRFDTIEAYTIKLTRDAELEIEEDFSQSMIKKMAKSLKQRKEGNPVRFIYDAAIPRDLLGYLVNRLSLSKGDALIAGSRYHNFKDFIDFPDFGIQKFRYEPFRFLAQKDMAMYDTMYQLKASPGPTQSAQSVNQADHSMLKQNRMILKLIRIKDILLHYPYHSFHYVIDLLRESSIDPKVVSIKITLYRVAENSTVINALINAVKNGKQVTVVMELQARFDEEANIHWSNKLQGEGVKVLYGVPGLKVHSKLCLITRREKGKPALYAMIGTGNFNETTAKVYTDHSLFTADRRITKEVEQIFLFFEHNYEVHEFRHLIVSPFNMRSRLIKLISRESVNAENGKESFIILKLNNLVDPEIIFALYKASQAGVKIRLIIRGMLSLIPGIRGVSHNIEAISIVDRFLEHTRICVFCNNGNERYYISSADFMMRNLDRRVEVMCPIYDKSIQYELQTFLDIQWADNIKARVLDRTQKNMIKTGTQEEKVRAQWGIYEYLKGKVSHLINA